MNLKAFLEKYPWSDWSIDVASHRIVENLWVFELPVSREELWPYIADTSRTNSLLGLPEMKFEEKEGRLFGSTSYAGIFHEWEEVPWQWRMPEELISVRLYSKGLGSMVRGIFLLERLEEQKTRVHIYFGWVANSLFGATFLKIGMSRTRKGFERVLNQYVAEIQKARTGSGVITTIERPALELQDKARSIVDSTRAEWAKAGIPSDIQDKLVHIITHWDDVDLYRIRPIALAHQLGAEPKAILRALLHGCHTGLFNLTWDVICPHCRGVREEKGSLLKLDARGSCDVCQIDFDATGEQSIEITFHVNASVRNVKKQFFCSAEPARKPHIVLQDRLAPGQSRSLNLELDPGRYRARIQGNQNFFWLEATPSGANEFQWRSDGKTAEAAAVHSPVRMELVNTAEKAQTFVVDLSKADNEVLRPGDLFLVPEYKELFPDERLPDDLKIDIGVQTILFTDIVGSSKMYNELGDTGAFRRVRDHFAKIGDLVSKNSGNVIKTVGDAVFAAFGNSLDGFKAALALRERFSESDAPVAIRLSLHTGPCLAVNLDTGIDYFGNTVNLAAKLQAVAGASEIAFTGSALESALIRDELRHRGIKPMRVDLPEALRWVPEEVYRC